MPSSKKAPSSSRMKVTSSARARISSRKIRKDTYKNLNESYIQSATQPQVITMTSISNVDPDPTRTDSSNAILSMLTKVSDSNRAQIRKSRAKAVCGQFLPQNATMPYGTERPPHIPPHTTSHHSSPEMI